MLAVPISGSNFDAIGARWLGQVGCENICLLRQIEGVGRSIPATSSTVKIHTIFLCLEM
jgi:hypothetical protein